MKTCLVCESNLVQNSTSGYTYLYCTNPQCEEYYVDVNYPGGYREHGITQEEILQKRAPSSNT